ncbi:MAG: LysR family transcriptional regulator [Planctomycetaceae bacterium]
MEMFCEVAKCRSFSKAADAQNVSQSSASQAIHSLEKRLGIELFDRSVRPLELTPAGAVYLQGCQKMLDEFRRVEDRVRQAGNRIAGRVRVASIYSVGLLLMDGYVQRYRELYPEADLELSYLHSSKIDEQVRNEQVDLGIVSFPRDSGDVQSIPWQEEPMILVLPPDHPLTANRSVSTSDLQGENFVGFSSELTIRKMTDRWLRKAKVTVNVVHEFDNVENIKRAVEIGSGVAILPAPTVKREVEFGSLQACPFSDVKWNRPLGIIHRRNKSMTAAAEKFVELLHEEPIQRRPDQSQDSRTPTEAVSLR